MRNIDLEEIASNLGKGKELLGLILWGKKILHCGRSGIIYDRYFMPDFYKLLKERNGRGHAFEF